MSGAGFRVEPGALDVHADAVDTVAGRVDQAGSAGSTVVLGSGAYGLLCAFVPALIDSVQRTVVDLLADSAVELRRSALGVGKVARAYTRADADVATTYDRTGAR